ncbi:FxLYD domain-containing protein [Dyella sp. ASV21]|uniref:FxLYD domain-containing protein n=1 Tax=Dyella sp. ASV21 TaxID=2795114 RepID=UPI0018EC5B5E|nr:FxLYD domain-containing protein [Dyella sp. ASV21]
MNSRRTLLFVLLGLGLMSSVAHAAASSRQGVRVGSYRVERDVTPGRNKVVGTLTNTGQGRVHVVRISFSLFDAKGRAVGRATDEVHDLAPGQTWKFHALARGNVSRARLLRLDAE